MSFLFGLTPAVERKIRQLPGLASVILASGDSLCGSVVVRRLRSIGLRRRSSRASSVAEAFARIGLPWDDAITVSAHGRPIDAAIRSGAPLPEGRGRR